MSKYLYMSEEDLSRLEVSELIDAHNELISLLPNLEDNDELNGIHKQLLLLNSIRIEKMGIKDDVIVYRVPRQ